MAYKDSRQRRWVPRGGSNPTRLEKRISESLREQPDVAPVKVFNSDEIAEYEKELKERNSARAKF
jgi:hypothetical protein